MKVLRIYDHLGELKKEFNVYVEGSDFKWEASVPEVIWLGTISLEELGEVPVAEPTPELGDVEVDIERRDREFREKYPEDPEAVEPEPEVTKVVPSREGEPVKCSLCGWEGKQRDCFFGHDSFVCPKCNRESIEDVMEVKDEPEKVHRKRSRVKRATPSASLGSTEGLSQVDSPGDTSKGN